MNGLNRFLYCDNKYEILSLGHTDFTSFIPTVMNKTVLTEKDEKIYGYRCILAKSEDALYKIAVTRNFKTGTSAISFRTVNNVKVDDLDLISALRNEDVSSLFTYDK